VDWVLLLQDGPEAVFEHDVTSQKAEEPLEWLRDCQILKNPALYSHSCGMMQNRSYSKSIITVNKTTKRFYWRIRKEVRKCPQGVTLRHFRIHTFSFFFLPTWAEGQNLHPRFRHNITCGRTNSSDVCICSVATTACLYLVTPVQPSLGSSTCKCNEDLLAGKEQTDVELVWAQRSEVVSDYNVSLQLSVYLLVFIAISSCLYLSVNGGLSRWIQTGKCSTAEVA